MKRSLNRDIQNEVKKSITDQLKDRNKLTRDLDTVTRDQVKKQYLDALKSGTIDLSQFGVDPQAILEPKTSATDGNPASQPAETATGAQVKSLEAQVQARQQQLADLEQINQLKQQLLQLNQQIVEQGGSITPTTPDTGSPIEAVNLDTTAAETLSPASAATESAATAVRTVTAPAPAPANRDLYNYRVDPGTSVHFVALPTTSPDPARQLDDLTRILANGPDAGDLYRTMPLNAFFDNTGTLQSGSISLTDSSTAENTAFILLGAPDTPLTQSGVKYVIVNDGYYYALDNLRSLYPGVTFIRADQANSLLAGVING